MQMAGPISNNDDRYITGTFYIYIYIYTQKMKKMDQMNKVQILDEQIVFFSLFSLTMDKLLG